MKHLIARFRQWWKDLIPYQCQSCKKSIKDSETYWLRTTWGQPVSPCKKCYDGVVNPFSRN